MLFFWYLSGGVFWGKTGYWTLTDLGPRFREWEYVLILQWEELHPAGNLSLNTANVPKFSPFLEMVTVGLKSVLEVQPLLEVGLSQVQPLNRVWALVWFSYCCGTHGSLSQVVGWVDWSNTLHCFRWICWTALLRTWGPRWLYGNTTAGQHCNSMGTGSSGWHL